MSFESDLQFGKKAEDRVADYFREAFIVEQSQGYDKGKDMAIRGLLEVKHDRLAKKTGNYAIEVRCSGKASGLSTTKATAWVLITDEGGWIVGINELRKWVKLYCYDEVKGWDLTKAGDGKQSEVALIPYSAVKTFRKIL